MKHSMPILTALAVFYKCAWAIPPQSQWYSTLKSPNERFVLNAEQATVAVQSAVAVAESNKYGSTVNCILQMGLLIDTSQCSVLHCCYGSLRVHN